MPAPAAGFFSVSLAVVSIPVFTARGNRSVATPQELPNFSAIEEKLANHDERILRLDTKINSDRQQNRMQFDILLERLHARDAAAKIKENDVTVISLGKRLLEASDYASDEEWGRDYATWENAITTIDRVIYQWDNCHASLFNDRVRDIDQNAPTPPPHINEHTNIARYKIVWPAQQSYANRRENIFIAFEMRGRLP